MVLSIFLFVRSIFASELSVQERLIGIWEFEFQESTRKENSDTKLQMACVEEIFPVQKIKKECVALIQVLSISPERETMDIFIHLEIQSQGLWDIDADSLVVETLEQKVDVAAAHVLINGIDVSTKPEMESFYQGLAKQMSETLFGSKTSKRNIVSIGEDKLIFKTEDDARITAMRK